MDGIELTLCIVLALWIGGSLVERYLDSKRAPTAELFTQPQVEEIEAMIAAALAENGLDKLRVARGSPKRISSLEWHVPNIDELDQRIEQAIADHATTKRDHPEGYARARREAEERERAALARATAIARD